MNDEIIREISCPLFKLPKGFPDRIALLHFNVVGQKQGPDDLLDLFLLLFVGAKENPDDLTQDDGADQTFVSR
jgi:hypothetical protein